MRLIVFRFQVADFWNLEIAHWNLQKGGNFEALKLFDSFTMKQITSIQNPFIKSLVLLQEKAKARKQSGTFLIEGKREIEIAMKGGYEMETILFLPELISETEAKKLSKTAELIEISKEIYQKLAYRDTTEGILAVAKSKSLSLSVVKLS